MADLGDQSSRSLLTFEDKKQSICTMEDTLTIREE
jgi:hypothetical protein